MEKHEVDGVSFITIKNTVIFYANDDSCEDESLDLMNAMLFAIVSVVGDLNKKNILFCDHRYIYNGIIVDKHNCFVDYIIFNCTKLNDAVAHIVNHNITKIRESYVKNIYLNKYDIKLASMVLNKPAGSINQFLLNVDSNIDKLDIRMINAIAYLMKEDALVVSNRASLLVDSKKIFRIIFTLSNIQEENSRMDIKDCTINMIEYLRKISIIKEISFNDIVLTGGDCEKFSYR